MLDLRWASMSALTAAIVLNAVVSGRGGEMMAPLTTTAVAAAPTAVINWNDVRQRIDGFGASHRSFLNPVMESVDLLFDKDKGIGLSLMRMSTRWAPTLSRTYTDPEIAQAAQARGATVWLTSMSPPAEWKTNGSLTNGGSLLPDYYDDYAALLADFILEMRSRYGLNIYALSIQNEPNFSASWPSCIWSADEFHAFVPILADTFSRKGVTSKIVMPEQNNWRFDRAATTMQDSATARHISIMAAHPYQMPDGWASPYKGVLPVWQTEYVDESYDAADLSMSNALTYAINIQRFMSQAEANAWHYYRLETLLGAKRLYVLGNFSKFIRPGDVRIGVSDDDAPSVTAYKNASTGQFVIVAVNKDNALTKTFTLNGFSATSVTPWVTSAALDLAPQPSVAVSGNSFTVTLPSGSVTTFVGKASGGSTPTAPAPPTGLRIIR